ncbi:hypothetical protein SLE2022_375270 [Rubroshorea leprosula]
MPMVSKLQIEDVAVLEEIEDKSIVFHFLSHARIGKNTSFGMLIIQPKLLINFLLKMRTQALIATVLI